MCGCILAHPIRGLAYWTRRTSARNQIVVVTNRSGMAGLGGVANPAYEQASPSGDRGWLTVRR
jgi:hypothetical protein